MNVDIRRIRLLKENSTQYGPVVYWMSRDQRVDDNWALLFAQQKAVELNQPLIVLFCLVRQFLNASLRQYDFMIQGLIDTQKKLQKKNISFLLLQRNPQEKIPEFMTNHQIGLLITDFDPLHIKQKWKKDISKKITIPFYEVDAHNIVPCWVASPKQEFAAYTFRPKIQKLLPEFLTDFPKLKHHPIEWKANQKIPIPTFDWKNSLNSLTIDRSVSPISWLIPGEKNAKKTLNEFLEKKFHDYPLKRNDPTIDATSNLSPYLHFGHISAQRIALEVRKKSNNNEAKDVFLEELIVRRELADNFCFYHKTYDNIAGFPNWSTDTLNQHRQDKREYLYTLTQFERAQTHDDLWNASQIQMVKFGKMHGYMRMYWAKKILEWTPSPEEALKIAIYLNDKYELDGRDPSGYVGIVWSIGGVHDRAWKDRKIFGKIRYMTYNGCKTKFNINRYIELNKPTET